MRYTGFYWQKEKGEPNEDRDRPCRVNGNGILRQRRSAVEKATVEQFPAPSGGNRALKNRRLTIEVFRGRTKIHFQPSGTST